MPTSSRDGMFLVGLVGQAGSGKTTVAQTLGRDGAVVIDADSLGHEVVNLDPQVRAALIEEYGADIYGPRGLDRRRVAERVFTDPEALARLNRLVHPRIVERIRVRLGELAASGYRGNVVLDAALLLDWGIARECDAVIAVIAPRTAQLERLAAQRGWNEQDATRVLESQRSTQALRDAADAVLDNDGNAEDLEREARQLLERLRGAGPGRPGRPGRQERKGRNETQC
jgi:dephospho-CoA kinase